MIKQNEIQKLKNLQNLYIKDTKKINEESIHKLTTQYDMWLDKYRPNSFADLLTEERINREILTWVRSWDDIVFNRKFTLTESVKTAQNNLNELNCGNTNNTLNFNNNFKKEIEYIQSKHKIILIAGPPGIGKTTLARVISKHCGYEPLVINASDERTSDKLLLRIYDATQLHNLNFSNKNTADKKPTCLILDEIDGALDGGDGKNAIKNIMDFIKYGKVNKSITNNAKKNVLSVNKEFSKNTSFNFNKFEKDLDEEIESDQDIKKIRKERKAKRENNDSGEDEDENKEENKKQMINKQKGVKRPIICICNDLYAKVLTILRKEALVFHIKNANPLKLNQRLIQICEKEKLNINSSTIKNICEKSNYDIRVCINTLQFISYNQNNLNLVKSLSSDQLSMLGCKDIGEGLFNIWSKIFHTDTIDKSSFNSVFHLYSSFGEFDKINDGIFVNHLKVPNRENELQCRSKLLDYLSYSDVLSRKINTTHNYELSRFQVIPGAYAKRKFNSNTGFKMDYPSVLAEMRKNKKINSRLIGQIKETFDETSDYSKVSKSSLVLDILPFVFQLIQPEIREINTELMNKVELKQLKTAINIMLMFGIKIQDKSTNLEEDNDIEESFYEPDIKKLLDYSDQPINPYKKWNQISTPTVMTKSSNLRITPKQRIIIKSEYEKLKNFKEITKDKEFLNKVADNKDKEEITTNRPRFDFFKRNSEKNIDVSKKRNFSQFNNPEYKFVYKYNEGVTNTVKRTLKIDYFFK